MPSDATPLSRRAYLGAAATAGLGALAGCGGTGENRTTSDRTAADPAETGTASPTETTGTGTQNDTADGTAEPPAGEYETVVDVAAAGADTDGEEPIDDLLNEHLGDDTLLRFPPGRYRLTELRLVGYRNLGLYGPDAALVPPEGKTDYWLQWGDLADFRFEGFTLDFRSPDAGPTTHLAVTGGRNVVRDVTVSGFHSSRRNAIEVAAAHPESELLFERVSMPDGSNHGPAIYTFPKSIGAVTFRDCRIEHWSEGLYASPQSGPLRVEGGYYANNGVVQVRVGGGHEGAVVKGVTVRADDPKNPEHKQNMRGIWQEEGEHVRIENCDVAITDLTGTYSSGGIVFGRQGGGGEIRDTRIRTDANAYGVHVRRPIESMEGQTMPSMDYIPNDRTVACENVEITGSASKYAAVRADGRDDCSFRNLCVAHPDEGRDGVLVEDAEGVSVRNSTVAVGGEPFVTENATVTREGVRTSGSCRTGTQS